MGQLQTATRAPRGRLEREPRRPSARTVRRVRGGLAPYLFLTPFVVLFGFLFIVPLGYALYLSVFVDRLVGGSQFVGVANYTKAFGDPAFLHGLGRMGLFGLVQVPVMLGLALIFAILLEGGTVRLRRLFRLGFFLPYAVPSVVAALMWGYLYGPTFGPFAQVAEVFGLGPPGFLTGSWMLASIGNIVTWEYTGYNMIILYAALQAVPAELYDAALVDGATAWRLAWHIKIPLIRPALVLTTVFSIIGTLQLFNEPKIMQEIAPSVVSSGYTPNLYAYTLAFTNQQYNYSAAISFALGAFVFAGSYVFMFLSGRRSNR